MNISNALSLSGKSAILSHVHFCDSHDLLFGPVITTTLLPGKFKIFTFDHMDLLDEELDGRSAHGIKTEKGYLQEVYVDQKVAMDVNGDDSANAGRWEVVEVIQDLNSNRNIHQDIICADALNSQDKVNPDDPPAIGDATVTYRVVQLATDATREDAPTTQIVTTSAALVGGQQVAQAIIANPFNAANGSASPGTEGPFYVMMSPQEVLQTGQRTLAPRTHQFSPKLEGGRTARDERRRATHNEVERRRRDKINNWIVKLSKIVPDCTSDHSKQGQGGILAKACDYIQELRNSCARLPDVLKENERLNLDLDALRQQYEELKNENQALRAHLQQQGITITTLVTNS